ncbi:MAG: LysR family transcriptional regulator [Pseudomonas sp.]|nr:LysR family transcriptional regulator [Pseudomonas sp.]
MESLANLEAFVQSAKSGTFSAAARVLGQSPAAVSKNVARLEAGLGVLLFQRSTRQLSLTEAGEQFLREVSGGLESIQSAISGVAGSRGQPAGTLKISMPVGTGFHELLPVVAAFQKRYPAVIPEIRLENRKVDLIAEGLDVAIGGGFELAPGIVARELMVIEVVIVAAPGYLEGREWPTTPTDLERYQGVVMRSAERGRLWSFLMRDGTGREQIASFQASVVVDDPYAMCALTVLGSGIAGVPQDIAAPYLASGELVRVLPQWSGRVGTMSIYYSGRRLLPAKTRAFIDFVSEHYRQLG